MLVAQVTPGRERGLRELLETMNSAPGMADPANAVLPSGNSNACILRGWRCWTIRRSATLKRTARRARPAGLPCVCRQL